MKKFSPISLVLLATAGFASHGFSQGTLAPLFLFTSGAGSVTPLQTGQLLEVGQSYDMTAVPDTGYDFSSWQAVNVFIITQTNFTSTGDPILPPIQSIVPSLGPTNSYQPELEFTMQPLTAITSDGSNPGISEIEGWQANFVPVPEPGEAELTACGAAITWFMAPKRRRRKGRSGALSRPSGEAWEFQRISNRALGP